MTRLTRRRYLAAAAVASLAGCSSGDGDGQGNYDPSDDEETTATTPQNGNGGGNGGDGDPEAVTASDDRTTQDATVETRPETVDVDGDEVAVQITDEPLPLPSSRSDLRSAARSGGPPKDGIPSIDEPNFAGPDDIDFLSDGDPVFGVARDGVVKAYPQKILVQHEIVNDTLGDRPVAVTYCPLTGTAQGFERGETTLGVSGRLINNNLVMYDRASDTWWPQIPATAIPGPWNEEAPYVSLQEFRVIWTTWGQWREARPDTQVLTTETGHARNYSRDPYGSYNPKSGYYDRESTLFPRLNPDDRFHAKRVFMGARTPSGAAAFDKQRLLEDQLMTGTLGETPALAVADPRYSTGYVYLNPEERSFEHRGDVVVGGDGSEHRPDELPLERIHTFDAMWFAWSGFYPSTGTYA